MPSPRACAFRVILLAAGLQLSAAEPADTAPAISPPPPINLPAPGPLLQKIQPPPAAPKPSAAANVPTSAIATPGTVAAIENSVVKIFTTVRRPDYFKPWTKQPPVEASGTGIIIEGKRILTNAHVVVHASQIQVQANQSGAKIGAEVESMAPGIDLAVLKLEDESFFDRRPPVPRARKLPSVKEPVMAYGFPTGGNSLSITKGIVSRIEFAAYHAGVAGLRIQIDAAINAGNSGGPAVSGDKMIGLAFARLGAAPGQAGAANAAGSAAMAPQNIAYIIPNEEIDLFLADIADGHYDGKPAIHDELQALENPALRAYLKLAPDVHGVVVNEPFGNEPDYPLKKLDVITHLADKPIEDDGMIIVNGARVAFLYLVPKHARNGRVNLTVFRAGKSQKVEVPTLTARPMLIPDAPATYPSYFIFGPIAFTPATQQLAGLATLTPLVSTVLSAVGNPLVVRRGEKPAFEGEELVVVPAPFFPHKLAKGYTSPAGRVVESVNGTRVKNLKHLVELLRNSKEEFIAFEFAGRSAATVVLPRKECIEATEDILNDNSIRTQGSADTIAVWKGEAEPKLAPTGR